MKLFVRVFQFINNLNSLVAVNGAKRKLVQEKEQKEKKKHFQKILLLKNVTSEVMATLQHPVKSLQPKELAY